MKPFRSIAEQIDILSSRNLIINDKEYAANYLLSNNYYNIINRYGKFFPMDGDNFTKGTTFEEVSRLYLFDKEIKQSLFKATIDIESHLKAIFAYHFAEAVKDVPYAYLNINSYDPSYVLQVIPTISKLAGTIKYYNKPNSPDHCIYHYTHTHHDIPIWVLVNYIDFGDVRHMLRYSRKSVQNNVAQDMMQFIRQHIPDEQPFYPETMLSFLSNINDLRNACAHNNCLLKFTCKHDSKYWPPLHDLYNISKENNRNTPYSTFIEMQCFLSKSEYTVLFNSIRKRMNNHLKNHLKSVSQNVILQSLGFPDDWNTKTSKINQNSI